VTIDFRKDDEYDLSVIEDICDEGYQKIEIINDNEKSENERNWAKDQLKDIKSDIKVMIDVIFEKDIKNAARHHLIELCIKGKDLDEAKKLFDEVDDGEIVIKLLNTYSFLDAD
jgi:hypothetical protein